MRKVLLAIFVLSLFFAFGPAFATSLQWADLPVGVDANGNVTTTHVYGYYTDVEGFGQVFVVCDPNTGEETGEACVPGVKIGERHGKKIVGYERKVDLDWDHPKQVQPVQVTVFAPNIPWSTEYDWDYFKQTGQLRRKTVNDFKWSKYTDYSFARLVPGDDPDYWLIVASITNPNPYPVEVSQEINLYGWWADPYSTPTPISKGYDPLVLGPNETKYVLLNRGHSTGYLAYKLGTFAEGGWKPGASILRYSASVEKVDDPEYPADFLTNENGKPGYYTPYVRWDGTNPVVKPLIPMRLAYDFRCSGTSRKQDNWGWRSMHGYAEYDPQTGDWHVDLRIYDQKPWWWNGSNEEWEQYKQEQCAKARPVLTDLFKKWYPRMPFQCSWWKYPMYANPDTGEVVHSTTGWLDRPWDHYIEFDYLEPVPPSNAPRADSFRWGGWLYTVNPPRSDGFELPAPVLVSYDAKKYIEQNWTYAEYCAVSQGGYFEASADPRYYDRDWMFIPLLVAEPAFVEKWTFHATDGDFGYLTKEFVPGYILSRSHQQRPAFDDNVQVSEVYVKAWDYSDLKDGDYYYMLREWKWTPANGWQMTNEKKWKENWGPWGPSNTCKMRVEVKTSHSITGRNPTDAPVTFKRNLWGNFVDGFKLYWPDAKKMESALKGLGNETYGLSVPADLVSQNNSVTLGANGKATFNTNKTYTIEFLKSRDYGDQWGYDPATGMFVYTGWEATFQSVLNKISANVLPLVNNAACNDLALGSDAAVVFGRTFVAGQGGIVSGAQVDMVHRWWKEYKGWSTDYRTDRIGFPGGETLVPFGPGAAHYSYFSGPTGGLIVRGSDVVLGSALNGSLVMYPGGNTPFPWRRYVDGSITPPNYL